MTTLNAPLSAAAVRAARCSSRSPLHAALRPAFSVRGPRRLSTVATAAAQEEQEEGQELPPELAARMEELYQEREAELQVQAVVEEILNTAQEWEYTGREREAIDMLRQGLSELSETWEMGRLMLQQRMSHLLFTAADYAGALQEARVVHDGLCRLSGENSPEAVCFGLRLGILESASGRLSEGNPRIYRAGAMAGPSLQRMIAMAQQLIAQGQEEKVQELNSKAAELAVVLGKSNFYGAVFTIKQLVQQGKAEDVVNGWKDLDEAVVQGLSNMIRALPPGVHQLSNALREHQRLVDELAGHPQLGERLQQQHAQLQRLVEQGPMVPGPPPPSPSS